MSRAEMVAALAAGQVIYCRSCASMCMDSKTAENLDLVLDLGCLLCGAHTWGLLTAEAVQADPRLQGLGDSN